MPRTSIFDVARVKWIDHKLVAPIKELNPNWHSIDSYYCLPNPKYFAVGCTLEHKSFGSEINLFAVPLFSKEINFNLSYADTIRGEQGLIQVKRKKASEIARELTEKVSPYLDSLYEKDDLNWFVTRLEDRNVLGNTRLKYDYGLALLLLNRFGEAKTALKEVSECEWEIRVVPDEAKNAEMLANLLEKTPNEAYEKVIEYLENNLRLLGFSGSN